MAIEQKELYEIVKSNFPKATVKIVDLVGDKDHYRIEVIDENFVGKNKVQQHRIVHKALDSILNNRLHAIEINTSSS
jgi:stress-induced morphogen